MINGAGLMGYLKRACNMFSACGCWALSLPAGSIVVRLIWALWTYMDKGLSKEQEAALGYRPQMESGYRDSTNMDTVYSGGKTGLKRD